MIQTYDWPALTFLHPHCLLPQTLTITLNLSVGLVQPLLEVIGRGGQWACGTAAEAKGKALLSHCWAPLPCRPHRPQQLLPVLRLELHCLQVGLPAQPLRSPLPG